MATPEFVPAEEIQRSVRTSRNGLMNAIDLINKTYSPRMATPLIEALRALAEFNDDFINEQVKRLR